MLQHGAHVWNVPGAVGHGPKLGAARSKLAWVTIEVQALRCEALGRLSQVVCGSYWKRH